MAEKVSHVYLRLSDGARHSQIDFDEIERLADSAELKHDGRDYAVYYFALSEEINYADANRIISALVTKPYIDEAWTGNAPAAESKPDDLAP